MCERRSLHFFKVCPRPGKSGHEVQERKLNQLYLAVQRPIQPDSQGDKSSPALRRHKEKRYPSCSYHGSRSTFTEQRVAIFLYLIYLVIVVDMALMLVQQMEQDLLNSTELIE